MAEDAVVVAENAVVDVDPVEEQARSLGWKPHEEFEGPEGKWVDAQEFVTRQPLFDKIDNLKSELWKTKQEHQREFNQIKSHFDQMKEVEFNRALNYLKAQKREALENADTTLVVEIDEQIDELKDQRAAEKVSQAPRQQGPDPFFVEWAEKNTWYAQDQEMRADADAFAMAFVSSHQNAPVSDVLKHVDKKMAQLHKDKFEGSPRNHTATVESNSSSVGTRSGKKKFSESDLSDTERDVMRTLVARKIITKEKYIDDLAIAKGLK